MKCPTVSPTLVIADDARLAAQISCVLAKPGTYLPIVDGPRLTRPDREAEIIRRNNAAARVRATLILLAGLSDESADAVRNHFPPKFQSRIKRISTSSDLAALSGIGDSLRSPPVTWGRDDIGIGLLRALRSKRGIAFTDTVSPIEHVASKSEHLVVCERGNDLAQVIAANYAYALRAGLFLIPEVDDDVSEALLEHFYNLYEERLISPTAALTQLKARLRQMCGPIPIPPRGSLTFVTGRLPYGFAFSEAPSTHLFKYPDLGISVVNGFAAEQPETRGVSVAVLVDPETTDAPEIAATENLLGPRGVFLRVLKGRGANVQAVADEVEHYPYDLIIIATHCGDASGYRWTYEFTDSEGRDRTLVVDIALGVGQRADDAEMLNVTQFVRFVSLDGVDWYDPDKAEKLYVGRAIDDYVHRTRSDSQNELKPSKKETVARVVGSAALRMYGNQNYISLPRPIAGMGTPIFINNACCSWHRLAETYMFCNARAYIGTLFQVGTSEAQDVIVKLLGKHFGRPLPTALWSAQREVYDGDLRRPYVMTGVYPQRLRVSRRDVPRHIARRLQRLLDRCKEDLQEVNTNETFKARAIGDTIAYYQRELAKIHERWLSMPLPLGKVTREG